MSPLRTSAPPSQLRFILEVLFSAVGIAASLWALYRLAFLILVLILAGLFAYVIAPLVQLAERPISIAGRLRRLPRGAAIALIYALMAGGLSAGGALLLPSATEQVNEMMARGPAYAQSAVIWEHGWSRYYERLRIPPELRRNIDQSVRDAGVSAVESARSTAFALVGALSNLPWLVLIPILAFFFLKDVAGFRRTLVTALPPQIRIRSDRLFEDLNATLAAYIRAQLLACVLVGSLCGIGFALLGIAYPVLLGALAGILEFIPLVGPFLLAVVASIVAALQAPILAFWTVGFLAAVRLVEDYLIYPRLMRRGLQVHPLAVIVAVLAGAGLAGVAGTFLAVPTVALGMVIGRHWLQWRRGASAA